MSSSASTTTTTTTAPAFIYPAHHSFPPFYTLQPNLTTRASQLTSWTTLILTYCAHHRVYRLSPTSPLFFNAALNRRLGPDDARIVLAHLASKGRAEWVSPPAPAHAKNSHAPANADAEAWIWWRSPDEWAALVAAWVDETGQRGVVLTLYELREGDATAGREFHGLPVEMLATALAGLARRGKVGLLGDGEDGGVKFF